MFSEVGVLIYVFDIESREFERDLITYSSIIKALEDYSPKVKVFCLVHKMDLVQREFRDTVFDERRVNIAARSGNFSKTVRLFATTIWDQTLYKAWGKIVNSLIPNLDTIESYLEHLSRSIDAEEVILFERTTFLTVMAVVSEVGARNPYPDRHERLSNIVKTCKHSLA